MGMEVPFFTKGHKNRGRVIKDTQTQGTLKNALLNL